MSNTVGSNTPVGLSNRSTHVKGGTNHPTNHAQFNREETALTQQTQSEDLSSTRPELGAEPAVQLNEDLCCLFPCCCGKPVYEGNPEALGFAVDTAGRSLALANGGAFFATAILRLAKEAAGCETDPPEGSDAVPECEERVYGLRPSTYIVLYTVVIGVITAALMPLVGSVVDVTSKRLPSGRVTAIAFVVLLTPPIFLSIDTWYPITILMYFAAIAGWTLTTFTYSYLPDVADTPEQLNAYTRSFTMITFGAMVTMILTVLLVSTLLGFGDDAVKVAQFSTIITVACNGVLLYCSWFILFCPRPPLREIPPDQSMWTVGFIQVYNTTVRIYRDMPALKWFYLSIVFIESGTNALGSISITYFTDKLAFSAQENGIFILITLLGSIPGGLVSAWTTSRWNPVNSSIMGTVVLVIAVLLAAIFLTGPGQQGRAYAISAGFGVGAGWKWTVDRLLASALIPRGQDTELMGFFLFSGQVFAWVPPLIFAAMNEAGVNQRVGIAILPIYLLLGICCLCCMGSYRAALIASGREDMLPKQSPANRAAADDTSSSPSRPPSPIDEDVPVQDIELSDSHSHHA